MTTYTVIERTDATDVEVAASGNFNVITLGTQGPPGGTLPLLTGVAAPSTSHATEQLYMRKITPPILYYYDPATDTWTALAYIPS